MARGWACKLLEPHGRKIAKLRVQSASVVYLVDEARKAGDHIGVSPIVTEIELLALDRFIKGPRVLLRQGVC